MTASFYNDNYIIFDPHPLVKAGLEALIEPGNKRVSHLTRLQDIALLLNDNVQQTVIMEL